MKKVSKPDQTRKNLFFAILWFENLCTSELVKVGQSTDRWALDPWAAESESDLRILVTRGRLDRIRLAKAIVKKP